MTQVIGLTGGIASGKSTVSIYLKKQGYPIVDADVVARQVVEPGTVGLVRIKREFGSEVITADKQLDRRRLGQIVFNSHQQLEKLNRIVQPLIRDTIIQQLRTLDAQGARLIFLDAPLLFEQHYESLCDQVMVVTVTPDVQLRRLMQRDSLNKSAAQARIHSQMPLVDKEELATVVIDNNSGVDQTYRQVDKWLSTVLQD